MGCCSSKAASDGATPQGVQAKGEAKKDDTKPVEQKTEPQARTTTEKPEQPAVEVEKGGGTADETQAKASDPRHRLSVEHAGKSDEPAPAETFVLTIDMDAEPDSRGLITRLTAQNIIDMIGGARGKGRMRCSMGSMPDMNKSEDFKDKTLECVGDTVGEVAGLGYTCRKGLKPESPNQDSWSVLKVDDKYSIYAVYDGHGSHGHDVSNFVKDLLPKLIVTDRRFRTAEMPAMLQDAFRKVQSLIASQDEKQQLNAQLSGTTATVCVHDHESRKLTLAHVADSTGVLGRTEAGALKGFSLTRDHKPNLEDEKARITKAGGKVIFDGYTNHRVYASGGRLPGLNMSRCLGDLMAHAECGVSCEPEVSERAISEDDKILLLCSDGVWEFMEPDEAVQLVSRYEPERAQEAANALAKQAWDRWIKEEHGDVVDDITVVLLYLNG